MRIDGDVGEEEALAGGDGEVAGAGSGRSCGGRGRRRAVRPGGEDGAATTGRQAAEAAGVGSAVVFVVGHGGKGRWSSQARAAKRLGGSDRRAGSGARAPARLGRAAAAVN